jgi:hypothetical protein
MNRRLRLFLLKGIAFSMLYSLRREPEFVNFKEPKNRFQGIDSVCLYSLEAAGTSNRIVVPALGIDTVYKFGLRDGIFKLLRRAGIDSASLYSLAGRYDNPIPTRFLAPVECSKIPAQLSPSFLFAVNSDSLYV